MTLRDWLRRALGATFGTGAAAGTGEPGGGVSSFHLWWVLAPRHPPIAEVAATLTVVEPPAVDRLYFWALQATFADSRRSHGAGHLGLQWNPRHPGDRAANWGGYADPSDGGGILRGTLSPLPSTPDDPNTRDYPWQPGRAYRLRIRRGDQGWRGEVTDVVSGELTAVRELLSNGDRLTSPVVWAEVFARCDHPSTAVAWTDLSAVGHDGSPVEVRAARTSFPTSGDCENTTVDVVDGALIQRTNAPRTVRAGALLPVGAAG